MTPRCSAAIAIYSGLLADLDTMHGVRHGDPLRLAGAVARALEAEFWHERLVIVAYQDELVATWAVDDQEAADLVANARRHNCGCVVIRPGRYVDEWLDRELASHGS